MVRGITSGAGTMKGTGKVKSDRNSSTEKGLLGIFTTSSKGKKGGKGSNIETKQEGFTLEKIKTEINKSNDFMEMKGLIDLAFLQPYEDTLKKRLKQTPSLDSVEDVFDSVCKDLERVYQEIIKLSIVKAKTLRTKIREEDFNRSLNVITKSIKESDTADQNMVEWLQPLDSKVDFNEGNMGIILDQYVKLKHDEVLKSSFKLIFKSVVNILETNSNADEALINKIPIMFYYLLNNTKQLNMAENLNEFRINLQEKSNKFKLVVSEDTTRSIDLACSQSKIIRSKVDNIQHFIEKGKEELEKERLQKEQSEKIKAEVVDTQHIIDSGSIKSQEDFEKTIEDIIYFYLDKVIDTNVDIDAFKAKKTDLGIAFDQLESIETLRTVANFINIVNNTEEPLIKISDGYQELVGMPDQNKNDLVKASLLLIDKFIKSKDFEFKVDDIVKKFGKDAINHLNEKIKGEKKAPEGKGREPHIGHLREIEKQFNGTKEIIFSFYEKCLEKRERLIEESKKLRDDISLHENSIKKFENLKGVIEKETNNHDFKFMVLDQQTESQLNKESRCSNITVSLNSYIIEPLKKEIDTLQEKVGSTERLSEKLGTLIKELESSKERIENIELNRPKGMNIKYSNHKSSARVGRFVSMGSIVNFEQIENISKLQNSNSNHSISSSSSSSSSQQSPFSNSDWQRQLPNKNSEKAEQPEAEVSPESKKSNRKSKANRQGTPRRSGSKSEGFVSEESSFSSERTTEEAIRKAFGFSSGGKRTSSRSVAESNKGSSAKPTRSSNKPYSNPLARGMSGSFITRGDRASSGNFVESNTNQKPENVSAEHGRSIFDTFVKQNSKPSISPITSKPNSPIYPTPSSDALSISTDDDSNTGKQPLGGRVKRLDTQEFLKQNPLPTFAAPTRLPSSSSIVPDCNGSPAEPSTINKTPSITSGPHQRPKSPPPTTPLPPVPKRESSSTTPTILSSGSGKGSFEKRKDYPRSHTRISRAERQALPQAPAPAPLPPVSSQGYPPEPLPRDNDSNRLSLDQQSVGQDNHVPPSSNINQANVTNALNSLFAQRNNK